MTQTTPTCLWNDSAAIDELKYAIDHGGVGATCNPVIAHTVVKAHQAEWRPRIAALAQQRPTATEDELAWATVEHLSIDAAAVLRPIFDAHRGRNGRLSIQTDPRYYRDAQAILAQAVHFSGLAPNMIVKIPATHAGITAIEEATAAGVSINATVSFTLPQCVAVAEAVERGLTRREAAGYDISSMGPVCTIMVGRLDDWLKVAMERDQISTDPGYLEWAGVAVFKKTYRLFRERGYRLRLLSAAFRNHLHWSEFIGGDVVISPPSAWQKRFVASDVTVIPRIDTPVDARIVDDLYRRFPDFRRAYDDGGMTVEEFDAYPATRRTLRQFLAAGAELNQVIRDVLLPNPDAKA
jgi:transaldolase